jgi:hypothetical protein
MDDKPSDSECLVLDSDQEAELEEPHTTMEIESSAGVADVPHMDIADVPPLDLGEMQVTAGDGGGQQRTVAKRNAEADINCRPAAKARTDWNQRTWSSSSSGWNRNVAWSSYDRPMASSSYRPPPVVRRSQSNYLHDSRRTYARFIEDFKLQTELDAAVDYYKGLFATVSYIVQDVCAGKDGGICIVWCRPRVNPFSEVGLRLPRCRDSYDIAKKYYSKALVEGFIDVHDRFIGDPKWACRMIEQGVGPNAYSVHFRFIYTVDKAKAMIAKFDAHHSTKDRPENDPDLSYYNQYVVGLASREPPSEWMNSPGLSLTQEDRRNGTLPEINPAHWSSVPVPWSADTSDWVGMGDDQGHSVRSGFDTLDRIHELRFGKSPDDPYDAVGPNIDRLGLANRTEYNIRYDRIPIVGSFDGFRSTVASMKAGDIGNSTGTGPARYGTIELGWSGCHPSEFGIDKRYWGASPECYRTDFDLPASATCPKVSTSDDESLADFDVTDGAAASEGSANSPDELMDLDLPEITDHRLREGPTSSGTSRGSRTIQRDVRAANALANLKVTLAPPRTTNDDGSPA